MHNRGDTLHGIQELIKVGDIQLNNLMARRGNGFVKIGQMHPLSLALVTEGNLGQLAVTSRDKKETRCHNGPQTVLIILSCRALLS